MKLIQAFITGDNSAFDKLVIKYKNMVFNLCYRILNNYEDAQDCAQEVFIKVYNNSKNFKFKSAFSTWLYRITVNTCKNKLNSLEYRFKKKRVFLEKHGNPGENSYSIPITDNSSSPDEIIKLKETEKLIQKAIGILPEKQKILVVLRDIEGKSYEEIVTITGFKLGTVKSKLSRAREILRKKLKGVIQ